MPRSKSMRLVACGFGVALLAGAARAASMPGTAAATRAIDIAGALPRLEGVPSAPLVPLHDPALVMGTLPNGMHYYLRANRAPAHRVELRLAVNAGSMLEDEDQRGFAHFLEHMAFNGTTHFPHNSLVDFIETSGMRFGADLNAFTTQDETVYLLTLPSDDPTILGKGLDILQDWADGGITVDSAEVVAERGVIMGEWRSRLVDTVTQRVRAHYDTLLSGGSPYLARPPIGDTTLIEHAEPGPIKRFYHDWYRPDLMTVAIVGDFDPVAMRQEVVRRFGAIPAATHPRPRTTPWLPAHERTLVDVFKGPVNPTIEVLWPAPPQPADARAAMRQQLVRDLLTDELQQRLLEMRAHPSRPFVIAQLEAGRLVRPLDFVGVQLVAWPDSLERGLAAVLGEFERVARNGIPANTLARRKTALLALYEHAAASASAQASASYADAYVGHYLTGEGSLLSAQQELALARELLPAITPQVLAQAARSWRMPAGRRVQIGFPEFADRAAPTRESVLALLDSVEHAPLAPRVDSTPANANAPLLATLPTPGTIVSESHDAKAGVTEWTLSNGAHVILKPTQNDPDGLILDAWSPGGFSVMPDSLFFSPGRMVARVMTDVGGVGTTGHEALADKLATTGVRAMTVNIGFSDESIDIAGSPKALATLFQLLYLEFTAPQLDSATLAGWQSLAKYQGPGISIDDQLNQAMARGNPRLLPVGTQLAELASVKQLLAAHHDRFGNAADFTFVIVGAVTPDEVRPLVERYVAGLPSTGQHETPKGEDVKPFLQRVTLINPVLPYPKAQTVMVFDGAFPTTPDEYLRERQRLGAVQLVLQDRLRVRLREQLAGTYSPFSQSETLALPDEHYRVLMGFDAAPERMQELNRDLLRILDSLRTHGVDLTEATRAATIQRRQLETALQSNAYWARAIVQYHRLGIPLDRIPNPFPEPQLTPAELQSAAKRYLPDDVFLHLTLMPSDSTSYPHGDSTKTE